LEILEYCDSEDLIKREQYYLDLLEPKYNLLTKAGSTLGYKHTEETLVKFKNRTLSEEQKAKLQDHLAKHNSSEEQRAKSRERMLKINEGKGIQVEVTVLETKAITTYGSIRKAAEALNSDIKAILYNEKTQKPFKGSLGPSGPRPGRTTDIY
jgi:group I intron endonuclease